MTKHPVVASEPRGVQAVRATGGHSPPRHGVLHFESASVPFMSAEWPGNEQK